MECESLVRLFAGWVTARSRHRAGTNGTGRYQSGVGAGKRYQGDCDIYGWRVRRADAGSPTTRQPASGGRQIVTRTVTFRAGFAGKSRRRVDLFGGLRDLPRNRKG